MAVRHVIEGWEAYLAKLEELKGVERVLVLFSGGKSPATGKSWCPDCVVAEPVVDAVVGPATGWHYVYCSVGGRDFWKDRACVFRTDRRTQLKSIPTLLKLDDNVPNTRLVEAQCANRGMVEMLLED